MQHDQRFKSIIQTFFVEFLELFFADWLDLIDASDIVWLEQEVSPMPPSGKRFVMDLVAQVRAREPIPPWHLDAKAPFALAVLIEIDATYLITYVVTDEILDDHCVPARHGIHLREVGLRQRHVDQRSHVVEELDLSPIHIGVVADLTVLGKLVSELDHQRCRPI